MSRRPQAVEVDRSEKTLWPDAGITKGDLADYLGAVAELMLPHLHQRPLTLVRAPDGIDESVFVQKRRPDHAPDWLPDATVPSEEGEITMLRAEHAKDLRWLADQACCEIHPWLSRADRPRHPDRAIIDLDPSDDDAGRVRDAALELRDRFAAADITVFALLTGGKGLHVVIPLRREADVDEVRGDLERIAKAMVEADPDRYTLARRKDQRGDKLYLDIARNTYAQTAVAPYSPRARPGAPVAVPVTWSEVEDGDAEPGRWTIANVRRRLAQRDDPWAGFARHAIGPARLRELADG